MKRAMMPMLVSLAYAGLFTVSVLVSEPLIAEVFKGTDSAGNTVYSDRPPDSGTVEKLTVETAPPISDAERERAREEVDKVNREHDARMGEKRMKEEEKAAAKKANRQRAAACTAAKERLADLEMYPPNRRLVTKADGTVHRVSMEEMQKLIKQARQQIQVNCARQ